MKLKKSKATLTIEAMIIFPIIFVVVIACVLNCIKPVFIAYSTEEAYANLASFNFYCNSEPQHSSETGDILLNGDIPDKNKKVILKNGMNEKDNNDNTKELYSLAYEDTGLSSRRQISFTMTHINPLTDRGSEYKSDLIYMGKKPSQVLRLTQKIDQ